MIISRIATDQAHLDSSCTRANVFLIQKQHAPKGQGLQENSSSERVTLNIGQLQESGKREDINSSISEWTMQTIEKYIDKMKAKLTRVIKNYPPFPPGSEERVKILKSFNSFRKEIERLTIPPDSDSTEELFDNVPRLSEDPTDEEVYNSIKRLETVKKAITKKIPKLPTNINPDFFGRQVEEFAAELKSFELRHTLTEDSTRGLTEVPGLNL